MTSSATVRPHSEAGKVRPTTCCASCSISAPQPWTRLRIPLQLLVGDVILEDGDRFEIVGRPTGASSGKLMREQVRRDSQVEIVPNGTVIVTRDRSVIQRDLSLDDCA